jgi:DNA-directed RNA polymerase specialized sigma subunit
MDEVDSGVIRMRYFDRTEIEIIAKRMFVSERAVYKRLDRIIADIVYCLNNTA